MYCDKREREREREEGEGIVLTRWKELFIVVVRNLIHHRKYFQRDHEESSSSRDLGGKRTGVGKLRCLQLIRDHFRKVH